MSHTGQSLREQTSNGVALRAVPANDATILGIGNKRVAALHAALHSLETKFKKRTVEFEMQVTAQRQAEECLRELTTRTLKLQDDQARRIARELHDSAGQYLAAIQMNLSALERDSSLTTSQAKRISDSIEMVTCCTSEIRTMSYLLHPPLLDEMGLPAALAGYSEGFAKRSGIRVELDIAEDLKRLPTDSETGIFRIVQQSLANIHRHSGSCVAKVTIMQDAEGIILEISDNGRGIAPEVLKDINSGTGVIGVGMAGMRERTRIMEGQFHVSSGSKGTTIEISVPFIDTTDHARP
ncbi:MAG TPA: sensor histidine kinase [Candidatus Acidoferrales bacterium]|nr:sensor histidine kinase [Candidatus Acidoferrales bacterium]